MRTRRSFLALVVALILAPILAQHTAAPVRAADPCATGAHYFEQTGFCVSGLFYDYWSANGGLTQQGLGLVIDQPCCPYTPSWRSTGESAERDSKVVH